MTKPTDDRDDGERAQEGVREEVNPDLHGAAADVEEAAASDDDAGPTPGGG